MRNAIRPIKLQQKHVDDTLEPKLQARENSRKCNQTDREDFFKKGRRKQTKYTNSKTSTKIQSASSLTNSPSV